MAVFSQTIKEKKKQGISKPATLEPNLSNFHNFARSHFYQIAYEKTLRFQASGINAKLPPVSYTKAIDIWIGGEYYRRGLLEAVLISEQM